MKNTKNPDSKSAFEAKFDAQKIAFAPVVFQVTKTLRDIGILQMISDSGDKGVAAESIAEKLDLSLYGVKTLLELGASIELVYLKQDRYILTKTGFFILHDPMTIVNLDFIHDVCYRGLFHLTDAIKNEEPSPLEGVFTSTIFLAPAGTSLRLRLPFVSTCTLYPLFKSSFIR